ncbi:alternative ribosome rescue aminoacyl-tRNA hydrolase ArfB [Alteromonas oceanisediminis]|uniref:alternative ribosome rescue aminoacyl-tRNA hydrolase ArfB n=1 Tax=Alteromonas oceanisediminis TaxID=2836180 RepID=UPI001BDACCBC|nr:alternative ribosome rescue aminoacyl-tRNA hydrolase ArfB [Alteromonas oceanisediminis]MBT0588053.1 aminoacyl-tRNA hydrolase [Alteromonas oceanisediminis]
MTEQLPINDNLSIALSEIDLSAMRAQGSGGQNVNKVSSAIHLRFDISASSLPDRLKEQLLNRNDSRVTTEGVLVIKAQQHRTQEANKRDALERLVTIINEAAYIPPTRKPTRPTRASQRRRIEAKKRTGLNKSLRGKVDLD